MTDSIAVAAFVFGLVLLIAGLIGKEVKIAAVEMPALTVSQRFIAAAIGLFLVYFGLTDGRILLNPNGQQATATTAILAPVANATGAVAVESKVPTAESLPVSGGPAQGCFGDVPDSDRIVVGIENKRETDRSMSTGQPRDGVIAVEFKKDGAIIGGIKFKTYESGVGFDILSVVDAACNSITAYENVSRLDQPKDAPYNYDSLEYHFGDTVISMYLHYGEGSGKIELRAQDLSD